MNSESPVTIPNNPSGLPRLVGGLLVCIIFPLIWVGGLVTTSDAGMAVPDWPNTYGYNLFLYPMREWFFGPWDLFVEHGHRLLGSLAGLIAILLVVVTFRKDNRRWVREFSVALLVLVIFQGVLGGLRVVLDERVLAKIHGCVGPAFFAAAVGFCVVTSRWWKNAPRGGGESLWLGSTLRRLAALMLFLSYAQLVLGAFLRHIGDESPPKVYQMLVMGHILTAILIVMGTAAQLILSRFSRIRGKGIRFSIGILAILVVSQFALGIGTWIVKFGWPVWFENIPLAASFVVAEKSFLQMNLITAHVAVGSLIVAMWTAQWIRCHRAFQDPRIYTALPTEESRLVNREATA